MLALLSRFFDSLVDDDIRDRVARMSEGVNEYGYDRWGSSPKAAERMLGLMRWLSEHYFRAECEGIEHVPAGRVLIIANHSAQFAYDGMLICSALALKGNPPRYTRAMIERFFADAPFVNILMSRMGQQIGLPHNCERLLAEDNAAVLVFPEGERGGGKVFADRYRIMGFGQGFLRLALRTSSPILPIGFVGGEEMCPSFSRLEPLARLVRVPYIPVTPTLLPLPLPAKVFIEIGEPLGFEGTGDEEDDYILPLVAKVERRVAELMERGLNKRKGIFFG